MIRWRFLVTRLLIVAVVFVLILIGLKPVAHYVTVTSLQKATGAKVDIGDTSVGFFPPKITYRDFRVADPRGDKEYQDAFRADRIELEIDGNELMLRRWVASSGSITGIQIGAQRDESGHLAQTEPESQSDKSSGPGMLSQMLGGLSDELSDKAKEITSELETVKQSKAIRSRWEKEYKDLAARAKELEQRVRDIRDSSKRIDNPLRDLDEINQTLAKFNDAREELMQVRRDIDSLPERLQSDWASLDQARQMDLAKADRYIPGNLSESQNFGFDLVTATVKDEIGRVREYFDHGRTIANYTIVAPESDRGRGENIDFLGDSSPPAVLVRRVSVGGLLRANGNNYELAGVVKNMTPTPEKLAEPLTARLRLTGPDVVEVEYIRDRRKGADLDEVTVHWPPTQAKAIRLGDDGDAAIKIEGGLRELWVQLKTDGTQVAGRFVSKQTGVQMGVDVDSKYADLPLTTAFQQSLASVKTLEVDANFAGTWTDLDMKLSTNLGDVLGRATKDAIAHQKEATRQQIIAKVNRVHMEQSQFLRNWLAKQQGEARTMLASADSLVEDLMDKVVKEVGIKDTYIGGLRNALDRLR